MKILIAHWNNILADVERRLRERGHTILENLKFLREADVLIMWNEIESSGRELVKMVHKLDKKVVLVQHGRGESIRFFPPFNEELLSDKCCVWGKGEKNRLLAWGVPKDRIEVVGCPILKHLKPKEKHEGINVVFSPDHWSKKETKENLIVAKQLRKLKGVKIITKILHGEHNYKVYDNPIISNRGELGHLEIMADVLSKADLVVGITECTFVALAEVLDIPVVIADIWTPRPCTDNEKESNFKRKRVYTDACTRVKDMSKLNQVILQQLDHPNELKRKRRKEAINEMGAKIKDPVGNIVKVVENI